MEAQLLEDLRSSVIVALIVGQTEHSIRVDSIVPLLLERIGRDLVGEADAATLLAQVDDNPPSTAANHIQGEMELFTAVALQGAQDLGRETLVVDPHRDVT